MQISAANLIAAQQAAQRALTEKSALAAKQAVKATPTMPAFALPDFETGAAKMAAEPPQPSAAPQQTAPSAGAKLGQHINIVV
jgi:hypothetical protein